MKKVWRPTFRVEEVGIDCEVTNDDLLFIFETMRPRVFKIYYGFELEGEMKTKHRVMELKSHVSKLDVLLTICSPTQKLTVTNIEGALTPDQLELLGNL